MTMQKLAPTVLVVDDDREIVRLVRAYLEQNNYQVLTAYDGKSALYTIRRERPDLVILDLMMPDMDGWEITRLIRNDKQLATLPIIMLTARVEDSDKIVGLELGADDYISKPFNPREVVARVRTVLRRTQSGSTGKPTDVLKFGDILIDLNRHEVLVKNQAIDVTQTEFSLLRVLMENQGYAFTRSELVERGLGHEYEGLERTLDSHVKNLRKKVEPDPKQPIYIHTVYGVGYRFG